MGNASWKTLQRFVYLGFVFSFSHFLNKATGLFTRLADGTVFVNLGELFALLMGVATILLQVVGFFVMRQRKALAQASEAAAAAAAKKAAAARAGAAPPAPAQALEAPAPAGQHN